MSMNSNNRKTNKKNDYSMKRVKYINTNKVTFKKNKNKLTLSQSWDTRTQKKVLT